MIDVDEQLRLLELQLIERMQKLLARLRHDLQRWNESLNSEALLETNMLEAKTYSDADIAQWAGSQENGRILTQKQVLDAIELQMSQASREKTRILTSMKDAVWASSNALRSAHQKRTSLLEDLKKPTKPEEVIEVEATEI